MKELKGSASQVLQLYVWIYSLHANIQIRGHSVLKSWISHQSSKWQRAQKKAHHKMVDTGHARY